MCSYSRFQNKSFFLFIAVFFLAGGVFGYILSQPDHSHHQVMITLESSIPLETQLFYDIGRGFSENDSVKKVIYRVDVPVTLNFDLSGPLNHLRFDPSRSPAKTKIYNIILKYRGEKPFTVPLDSLTAEKDIKSTSYDGKTLTVETTEAAEDPILYLSRIGPAPQSTPLKIIAWILTGAFAALVIAFFIVWVYRNSLNSTEIKV